MRWLFAIGELALMCWFVAIGLEAIVQRVVGMRSPFKMGELHHAYIGVALVGLGFRFGIVVQLVGLVLTVDDVYQHQVQTLNGFVDYRSPLHQLFARYLWPLPIVRWLTHQLDRWWFVGVVLGLLALWIFGCAPAQLVPGTIRPDTRALSGILFDTAVVRAVVQRLRAAYPKEAAVCLYGEILDTAIAGEPRRIVHVAAMQPSAEDSANEMHVWFPRGRVGGCDDDGLVGVAHSHPLAVGARPCTHSDPDANVLFLKPRALFSMLFCGDGRGEIFYQDGRRSAELWARPIPASP